jgi:hypothetical protein
VPKPARRLHGMARPGPCRRLRPGDRSRIGAPPPAGPAGGRGVTDGRLAGSSSRLRRGPARPRCRRRSRLRRTWRQWCARSPRVAAGASRSPGVRASRRRLRARQPLPDLVHGQDCDPDPGRRSRHAWAARTGRSRTRSRVARSGGSARRHRPAPHPQHDDGSRCGGRRPGRTQGLLRRRVAMRPPSSVCSCCATASGRTRASCPKAGWTSHARSRLRATTASTAATSG